MLHQPWNNKNYFSVVLPFLFLLMSHIGMVMNFKSLAPFRVAHEPNHEPNGSKRALPRPNWSKKFGSPFLPATVCCAQLNRDGDCPGRDFPSTFLLATAYQVQEKGGGIAWQRTAFPPFSWPPFAALNLVHIF